MLLIVSFALVLLATGLLIVGLLSDGGLTLIYISMAFSAAAALVLLFASRMARPASEPSSAPEPLPSTGAVTSPTAATVADAPAPTPTSAPAPVAAPPAAAPEPEPAPAPEPTQPVPVAAAADDNWADEVPAWDGDDDEYEFPIADYDDLKVAEIMPLLPQLYSDELDVVADREAEGKNRSTILKRIDELRLGGTIDNPLPDDDAEETAAAPAPAPAAAPAADEDDDWDDDEYFFPIADYDELTVSQIMPLLPQLEADELEDVRDREQATSARKSILLEIDRLLGVESEPAPADDDDAEEAPAAGLEEVASLTVAEIRGVISDLDDDELAELRTIETDGQNRKSVIDLIDRRLGTPAPARKARAPKKAARKSAKSAPKSKKATKRAKKATKKKASAKRFPIGNYDDLTVADIRPRLTKLSDAQLRQVRDREAAGAGRKTILDDIDNRLS